MGRAKLFGQSCSIKVADPETSHWDSCLEDARYGSREAQARLLDAVRPYLLAVAEDQLASDLRPKLAASDLVQNVVLKAWQSFGDFRGQSRAELIGWLRTILCHCAALGARSYRGTKKRDVARECSLNQIDSRFRSALADSCKSPSEEAVASEERQRIDRALRRLASRYEQAIRLRNDLGLSFAEMGAVLDCSEDAARMLWVRALDKLGRQLRREEFEHQ